MHPSYNTSLINIPILLNKIQFQKKCQINDVKQRSVIFKIQVVMTMSLNKM